MSKGTAVAPPQTQADEFNPFQSMAQLFDTAADYLGLDEGIREVLRRRFPDARVLATG